MILSPDQDVTRNRASGSIGWRALLYIYTVFAMVDLLLNRRLNTRNILLAQGTRGEHVGYLLPNGGRRFVQWLGFIERSRARAMKAARPVRLVDITRVGRANGHAPEWHDLTEDSFVHGCVTEWGAYAVYEENLCLVGVRSRE